MNTGPTKNNNIEIKCDKCGNIIDLSLSDLAKQLDDLKRKTRELEKEINTKDRALNDTKNVLTSLQEEMKNCQELKVKIDQEVEKRIEKLLYKGFAGCGRCSKPSYK